MGIGKKISKLRFESGLTQKQLGDKVGVSRSTIGFYESDKYIPTAEHAKSLADFFGVSVEFLMADDEASISEAEKMVSEIAAEHKAEFTAYIASLDPGSEFKQKVSPLLLLKQQIDWLQKKLDERELQWQNQEAWYKQTIHNLTLNFPEANEVSGRIISLVPQEYKMLG